MFKVRVRYDPKFFIRVKNAISGWVLKKEKTSFTIKGHIGNEDKYARDLPEYARDLPLLARKVCGKYVYVKAWIKDSNTSFKVATQGAYAKIRMFLSGDVNYGIATSVCRAYLKCKITTDALKYKLQTEDVRAKIAYKTHLNNANFTVMTGMKERFGIIARGNTIIGLKTEKCRGFVKAKGKGLLSYGVVVTLSEELHQLLYARDNPVYAKDNPIMAKDLCYVVV